MRNRRPLRLPVLFGILTCNTLDQAIAAPADKRPPPARTIPRASLGNKASIAPGGAGNGRSDVQNRQIECVDGRFISDKIMIGYLWKSAPHPICRKASGGVIRFRGVSMRSEPPVKRAFAFFDGQNLFHAAKEAFGYPYPNYDVAALAKAICRQQDWQLEQTHFYTGLSRRRGQRLLEPLLDGQACRDGTNKRASVFSARCAPQPNCATSKRRLAHFRWGQEKESTFIALDVVRSVRRTLRRCREYSARTKSLRGGGRSAEPWSANKIVGSRSPRHFQTVPLAAIAAE